MQFSARVNANSQFFMIIILTTVLFLICPLISILVAYWVLLRENKEKVSLAVRCFDGMLYFFY